MAVNERETSRVFSKELSGSARDEVTKIETSTPILKPNIAPFLVRRMEQELTVWTSLFGTPAISNLLIEGATYKDQDGNTQGFGLTEFDTVVITVNQTKNIVTTPIQGRNGTVKEYISDGDFDITININICNAYNNTFPKAEVEALYNILKANTSLQVNSDFLNYFGITDIVVTNYTAPQVQGTVNEQNFIINAISDEPFEVRLSRDANS